MFARTHFVCALTGLAILINSGCQTTDAQPGISGQHQTSATARKTSDNEIIPDVPPQIRAETYLAAARLHESQNRPMAALQQYQHALAEDPRNVHILIRIGVLQDKLGNSAMAEKSFQEALRLDPENAQAHNNLGFNYILRSKWEPATASLTRAVEIAPDFAKARVNLAVALAMQEQFDQALEQFQSVLPPEEAYYNLGLMYQSRRKQIEAAAAFKKALEASPELIAAQERLEQMPSDALDAADRKLQEERVAQARLAAAQRAPARPQIQSAGPDKLAEPKAGEPATVKETATVKQVVDAKSDKVESAEEIPFEAADLLVSNGCFKEEHDTPSESTAQKSEVEIDPPPTTRPADGSDAAADGIITLDKLREYELDLLLSPWLRSCEPMWGLDFETSLMTLADQGGYWQDWQESPAQQLVDDPEPTAASETLEQSVEPE